MPEGGQRPRLRVAVTDGRGRPIPAGGLARWLAAAGPKRARGAVTIALIGDRSMRELNRRFRRADYATDVLSFPASDDLADPRFQAAWLGDIAIATGVAARQAKAHGHARGVEIRILALHGLLHLLGYDHDVDSGQMRGAEERLRRRAGLPTGVIARVPTRTSR